MYHTLTKTDLSANLPEQRNTPEFRFFIDYIPRESTASAIMMVGAKDPNHLNDAMMWTILGFPLTSVAIPTWISAGNKLPLAVTLDKNFKLISLKLNDTPLFLVRSLNNLNPHRRTPVYFLNFP